VCPDRLRAWAVLPPLLCATTGRADIGYLLNVPDGKRVRFHDSPARHLLVEPDPVNGELRLVIKRGRPAYLYRCREERQR
jgi:hypothetical protein